MSEKMRVSNPAEGSEISPYDAMLQEKYMGDYDEGDVSVSENENENENFITPEERVKSASAEQGEASRRLERFGRVIGSDARKAVEASKIGFDQTKAFFADKVNEAREVGEITAETTRQLRGKVVERAKEAKDRVADRKDAAKNRIDDEKEKLQGKIDDQKDYIAQNRKDKETSEDAKKQEEQAAKEIEDEKRRAAEELEKLDQQKQAEIEKARQEVENKIAHKKIEQNNYLAMARSLPDNNRNKEALMAMAEGAASEIVGIQNDFDQTVIQIGLKFEGAAKMVWYKAESRQNILENNVEQHKKRRQEALESRAARKAERKAKRGEAYKSAAERAKTFGLSSVRKIGGALGRAAGFAKNKAQQGINAAKQTAGQFASAVREGYNETTS